MAKEQFSHSFWDWKSKLNVRTSVSTAASLLSWQMPASLLCPHMAFVYALPRTTALVLGPHSITKRGHAVGSGFDIGIWNSSVHNCLLDPQNSCSHIYSMFLIAPKVLTHSSTDCPSVGEARGMFHPEAKFLSSCEPVNQTSYHRCRICIPFSQGETRKD